MRTDPFGKQHEVDQSTGSHHVHCIPKLLVLNVTYDTTSHSTVFLLSLVYCGSFPLKDISWRLQSLACLVKGGAV